MRNDLDELLRVITHLSDCLDAMALPLLLKVDGKYHIQESIEDIESFIEDFNNEFRKGVRIIASLAFKVKLEDTGFSKRASRVISECCDIYDIIISLQNNTAEDTTALYKQITESYIAIMQLVRAANTVIVKYNQIHPDHLIGMIKGLDGPQTIEGNVDLELFLKDFLKSTPLIGK